MISLLIILGVIVDALQIYNWCTTPAALLRLLQHIDRHPMARRILENLVAEHLRGGIADMKAAELLDAGAGTCYGFAQKVLTLLNGGTGANALIDAFEQAFKTLTAADITAAQAEVA